MTSRYLIWDFDGTLGRRRNMWSGAMIDVLQANGYPHIVREQLLPHLQAGFRWHNHHLTYTPNLTPDQWWAEHDPIFAQIYRDGAALDEATARRLAPKVRHAYLNPEAWSLFPDSATALATLTAQGWRHVILSNHVPELPDILRALGIHHHFEAVFNSADLGFEKPHPEIFKAVRSSLPTDAQLWMIGDNPHADVEGAEAAGIPAILVRRPHPSASRFTEKLDGLAAILGHRDSSPRATP